MRTALAQYLADMTIGVRDFLMPAACAVCREPLGAAQAAGEIVCGACTARLVPLVEPICSRCGHPRLSSNLPQPVSRAGAVAPDELPPCRFCERLPHFVRSARSFCRMDRGTGAAMVHALKYGGWPDVGVTMGARMARLQFPRDVIEERTALIPIPLSRVRHRERGYNQAESLARALGRHWKRPVWTNLLERTRHTRSQVELTPSERASNVSNAFTVVASGRERLRGAHVVLVDDVITTASTLNAAATALADGGVRIVSYASFGRAPDPGDRIDHDVDTSQE